MNKLCVVVTHYIFGHTMRLAEQVAVGVSGIAGVSAQTLIVDPDGMLPSGGWELLESAEGIIFGCPTVMGGPTWQFKKFADASAKVWAADGWRDKFAAGFTNSGAVNGDKSSTISYLMTLAMQHSMFWVGTGLKAANTMAAQRDDLNWLGGFSGLLSQAPVDSDPEIGPPPGDLRTARHFGRRFGTVLRQFSES